MARRISAAFSLLMAVISFLVALVPVLGIVMKNDAVGRAIFGTVWGLVGIGWLVAAAASKRSQNL